ncbi:unnamed protein product [Owenia fusiformis]|uniref:Uncharacterized protein n=1 Tax=Owenia fusiformis TaxID=6347 RepID=A0A8J1UAR6_OWEFU|nr:unnamed protein product [Owenia fusiformis]
MNANTMLVAGILIVCILQIHTADAAGEEPLIVAIAEEAPFVYVDSKSNDTVYTGFIPDLVKDIMKRMKRDYEFKLVDSEEEMVSAVETGDADIASLMTSRLEVEKRIDLSKPYLSSGIAIMMMKPESNGWKRIGDPGYLINALKDNNNLLLPFSIEVWVLVVIAYVVVSLFLFVINRFNPYEGRKRASRNEANVDKDNLNCCGSFWIVMSTLQWQGYERSPKSLAGRLVLVGWFAFVTFILVAYTANLVTLMQSRGSQGDAHALMSPIQSLEDLGKQTEVKYGIINGTMAHKTLRSSTNELHQDMWSRVQNQEGDFPGISKGLSEAMSALTKTNGENAVLVDYHRAKHAAGTDCRLRYVYTDMASYGYRFGINKASDLDVELNKALLEIREDGSVSLLQKKWFADKAVCSLENSSETKAEKKADEPTPCQVKFRPLYMADILGVVVLFLLVLVLAFIVMILEVVCFRIRSAGRFEPISKTPCDEPDLKELTGEPASPVEEC